MFGVKGGKDRSKSMVLWSRTCGQVPAVRMDALSAVCSAAGEAGGAWASPYSKGFVVLWSEHYSVQNRVKTLNQWWLGELCGNNCSEL